MHPTMTRLLEYIRTPSGVFAFSTLLSFLVLYYLLGEVEEHSFTVALLIGTVWAIWAIQRELSELKRRLERLEGPKP
jgi:hypothetical protein